jgi:hypothetical protein
MAQTMSIEELTNALKNWQMLIHSVVIHCYTHSSPENNSRQTAKDSKGTNTTEELTNAYIAGRQKINLGPLSRTRLPKVVAFVE